MDFLKVFTKLGVKDAQVWADSCKQLSKFGIVDQEDICRFLANCFNESGKFTNFKENLYYTTADRLIVVFPKAFDPKKCPLTAKYNPNDFLRNPDKLANLVYNDTIFAKGLGNTVTPTDGSKFIGRSAIQITGRYNYQRLTNKSGIDFINHPEYLEQHQYALLGAASWWQDAKCSNCTSLLETRQKVAGNYTKTPFGLAEVTQYYNLIKSAL